MLFFLRLQKKNPPKKNILEWIFRAPCQIRTGTVSLEGTNAAVTPMALVDVLDILQLCNFLKNKSN